MNKVLNKALYIFFMALGLAFLASCDEIDTPYKTKVGPVVDTSKSARKILIEEFTGSRCQNCPAAGDLARSLVADYKGNVILVSIHAGDLATPDPEEGFPYKFTTTEGDELFSYFGIPYTPAAMLNRLNSTNTSKSFDKGAWSAKVAELNGKTADVRITLTAEYNQSTKKLTTNAGIYYPKAGTSNHQLVVYVIEDSIIQPQIFSNKTVPDYCHLHVLRCSLNSTWGEKLSNTDIPIGSTFNKTYSATLPDANYPNSGDWVPSRLHVVAFVIDKDASGEVLQAEEADVVLK
jgi:hypothetical protein